MLLGTQLVKPFLFSGFDSFISVKYHHVYPVPKIFWNRYTQKMHNDNDTYYVQTTNTTIFFFHLFFLFLLSWLFPEVSGFFKEGEGMLLLKGDMLIINIYLPTWFQT